MAILIDDQGGTGWTPGSHTHFRLAAAWLPTAHIPLFQAGVRRLRQTLGLRAGYEFKFSKTHNCPEWRNQFYGLAKEFGLRFTACSFNKRLIRPGSVCPYLFYQVAATVLAVNLRETLHEAEAARCAAEGRDMLLREPIVVDDNRDRDMLAAVGHAFRALRSARDPNAILTNKPEFRDSEKDESVQLADMVMGAIGAHLDGNSQWYDYIRRGGQDLGIVELSGFQNRNMLDDLWDNTTGRATPSCRLPGPS